MYKKGGWSCGRLLSACESQLPFDEERRWQALTREAEIQNDIMLALSQRGHRVFRSNAGKIRTDTGRFIQLFPRGFPDLLGWRKSDGKFFCIEVKNKTGKLRDAQKRFASFAETQPILYGVARSAADALAIVEREEKNTSK